MDKPKLEEYLTSDLINKDYKPVVEKRTYEVFTKDQLKARIKWYLDDVEKELKGINTETSYKELCFAKLILEDFIEECFKEILKE